MKWLITGGCGFIGRNLIRHLLRGDEQHFVRVLDNLSVGTRVDLKRVGPSHEELSLGGDEIEGSLQDGVVQLLKGDVLDADGVQKAATGIDLIVHLAANTGVAPSVEDPRHDCETNVIGTLRTCFASRCLAETQWAKLQNGAQKSPVVELPGECRSHFARDPRSRRP
ncbi:nucleoside-diphosphate-sugar epimerase [Salinibacter ruber]|nr:nucleoside-diphosphate-sugar epimerase [Salinibacter ruber]